MHLYHARRQAQVGQSHDGIGGLFWLKSPAEQRARIRDLSRSRLSAETISTITRKTLREVHEILDGIGG